MKKQLQQSNNKSGADPVGGARGPWFPQTVTFAIKACLNDPTFHPTFT